MKIQATKITLDFGIFNTPAINKKRAQVITERILPLIADDEKIIDIGCGKGYVSQLLMKQGKKVAPIDIQNQSKLPDVRAVLYDGQKIPFPSVFFDASLLIFVLHHTPDPSLLLSEAARVSRRVIIMETLYRNFLDNILILIDGLQNKSWAPFWFSYKTDNQWKKLFSRLGFKIITTSHFNDLLFLNALYQLEK